MSDDPQNMLFAKTAMLSLLDGAKTRLNQVPVSVLSSQDHAITARLFSHTVAAVSFLADALASASTDPLVSEACGAAGRTHLNRAASLIHHEHTDHPSPASVDPADTDPAKALERIVQVMAARRQAVDHG